jgi:hypothetical protein
MYRRCLRRSDIVWSEMQLEVFPHLEPTATRPHHVVVGPERHVAILHAHVEHLEAGSLRQQPLPRDNGLRADFEDGVAFVNLAELRARS